MEKSELIQRLKEFIKENGELSTLADLPDDPANNIDLKDNVVKFYQPREVMTAQNHEDCKKAESKILLKDIIAYLSCPEEDER